MQFPNQQGTCIIWQGNTIVEKIKYNKIKLTVETENSLDEGDVLKKYSCLDRV